MSSSENVSKLTRSRGFEVHHVAAARRGDRGIDVYATKAADREQVSWVVQCKRFGRQHKVGPSVVRKLVGTLSEYPVGTRGMTVTTSRFSREANSLAEKHGIRHMDGQEFAALLNSALS